MAIKRYPRVEGANTPDFLTGLALMRRIWKVAAPYYQHPHAPMPRVTFTTGADALFVGFFFDPPDTVGQREETGQIGWPDWINSGQGGVPGFIDLDPAMLNLLIHEWAHYFQVVGLNIWEAEGGAQAFARQVSPSIFASLGITYANLPFGVDQYTTLDDTTNSGNAHGATGRVLAEKSLHWILIGQFRRPETGSASPKVIESGPERSTSTGSKSPRGDLVLPADPSRSAHPVDRIVLEGRQAKMTLGDRLSDASRDTVIDGASSVSLDIWDRDRRILNSGTLGKRIMAKQARVTLDGLGYIAADLSRSGDILTVVFEGEMVTKARGIKPGHVRGNRADMTRAEFVARQFRKAGIPIIVLDEHTVEPIAGQIAKAKTNGATTGKTGRSSLQGVPSVKGLKVRGADATPAQMRIARTILATGASMGATYKVLLAGVIAPINETALTNVDHGDAAGPDSRGIYQQRATWGPERVRMDPAGASKLFFAAALKRNRAFPNVTPAQLVALTQFPGATSVKQSPIPLVTGWEQQWVNEATAILKAFGVTKNATTITTTDPFFFEIKKTENLWTAATRLIRDEVQWRLFEREGVIIIAPDKALIRAAPSVEIDATSDLTEDGVDFENHRGMKAAEASVRVLAARYQVDSGEVARVTGQAQVNEDWLISSGTVPMMGGDPFTTVALTQPIAAIPEPAPSTTTTSVPTNAAPGSVDRLFAECKRISDAHATYLLGGGHTGPLAKVPTNAALDCSGSTSLALFRAGLFKGHTVALVSGQFETYGGSGQGKDVTIWADAGHVFIRFNGGKYKGYEFNTAGHPRDRGPRLLKQTYPTAGFTARHPNGL